MFSVSVFLVRISIRFLTFMLIRLFFYRGDESLGPGRKAMF